MPEINHPLEPIQLRLLQSTLSSAYSLLPSGLCSPEATQMLLAIGWQESRFEHRHQLGGPAKGFWQFERGGGVKGVLEHPKTRGLIRDVLIALKYENAYDSHCYTALEHNDVLAAAFARLLLVPHPKKLPLVDQPNAGWDYYLACWRPGKPHAKTWLHAWEWAHNVRQLL